MENRISKKLWAIFNTELLLFLNELEVNEELSESTPNEIFDKWIEYINRENEENKPVKKEDKKNAPAPKLILTPSKNAKTPQKKEVAPVKKTVKNDETKPKADKVDKANGKSDVKTADKTPIKTPNKTINKFEDNTCQYVYARTTKNNIKGQKYGAKCTESYCSQHKKTVEARLKKGQGEKSSENRDTSASSEEETSPSPKKPIPKTAKVPPKITKVISPKTPKSPLKSPLNLKLDLNKTLDKYVHKHTGLVFDKVNNINFAIGKVDKNNKIHPLSKEDLDVCNEYGFKYRTSDTTASKKKEESSEESKSEEKDPNEDKSEDEENKNEKDEDKEENKNKKENKEDKDIHAILKEIKNGNSEEDDIIDEISTEDEEE